MSSKVSLKNGFTLIESLIAILALGLLLSAIFRAEMNSLNFLSRRREQIDRVFVIKKHLEEFLLNYSSFRSPYSLSNLSKSKNDPTKKNVEKLDDPKVNIEIVAEHINKKSSLADFKNQILIASANGVWSENASATKGRERNFKMVSFILAPPKIEK